MCPFLENSLFEGFHYNQFSMAVADVLVPIWSQVICNNHAWPRQASAGVPQCNATTSQDLRNTGLDANKYQLTTYFIDSMDSAATLYFLSIILYLGYFAILLYYTFWVEKAWNTFFILYWKGFTSIFQDDDCRPYWVLLNSKIEEWSHLVNLLVRSTCALALRMELESSSDTVASKVYSVIWNKVTLGEYI